MLSYQIEGKGKPILLIHAFPLSSQMWKEQIKILSSFSRVIALDLPGFGKSPRIPQVSLAEMAEQIHLLLEQLKIQEPVFIAGLSMGGYIAFEFFRQFPERISGLGLFSTRAKPDTPEGKQKRMEVVGAIEKEGTVPFAEKTVKNLLGKTSFDQNPNLVVAVKRQILQNSKEGINDALKAMASRSDSTALLGQIAVPVLVMGGQEDTVIPVDEMKAMAGVIRGAEIELFEKAGHLINLEAGAQLNEKLADFIKRKILKTGV